MPRVAVCGHECRVHVFVKIWSPTLEMVTSYHLKILEWDVKLYKLKPKDSLVEIVPGVLEKIVKFRWCILAIISPWNLEWPKRFFGWNWPRGSGEDCQIPLMYFGYYLPLEFGMALKTNLNPLNKRILFARFGWNWPYGSGEDFLYVVDVILPFSYKGLSRTFLPKNLNSIYPRILCA